MRKLILLLLLVPDLLFSQQKKEKRVCVPPRTQVIACCCDSPKVVLNVAPSSQFTLDPDLKKAIIDELNQKDKPDYLDIILKLFAAIIPIFLAWLAYKFARRQSRFDNLLKADIEWIKDFRDLASDVLADLHKLMLSIDVVDIKKEALDYAERTHQQHNTSQSKAFMDNARSEMNVATTELFSKYSASLKPLMQLKLALNASSGHQVLVNQIEALYDDMSQNRILDADKVEVLIENIRTVLARQRSKIENFA